MGLRQIAVLALLGLFLASSCGESATRAALEHIDAPAQAGDSGLPWPPADELARTVSDDTVVIHGRQYSQVGGVTEVDNNFLRLGPGGGVLTWAVYSLQGFGPDSQLGAITADYMLSGATTRLHFGLADYAQGRWRWFELTPQRPEFELEGLDPEAFASPGGALHIAVVLDGNGFGLLRHLQVERVGPGATVPVPTGLAAEIYPGRVELSWDEAPFVQGYHVYRSTDAQFTDEVRLNEALLAQPAYGDTSVAPFTDYWYRATAVRSGQESARSSALQVTTIDSKPIPPQNVRAEVEVGKVTLSWDASFGATSYIVHRAEKPDFSNLFPTYTPATEVTQQSLKLGMFFYFRVIAVGVQQSDPSTTVSVYVPRVDLPAPTNFRVVQEASHGTFVKFAWDWPLEENPLGFRIWLHLKPDFYLDGQEMPQPHVPGSWRQQFRYDLPQNKTLYARIAAWADGADYGRMSDAIEFTTGENWTWGEVETIGTGSGPISLLNDGSDLTLAYINTDDRAVRLARRDNGVWTTEITCNLESGSFTDANNNYHEWWFEDYLDLAYADGQYLVGAHGRRYFEPEDAGEQNPPSMFTECWASVGTLGGAWDEVVLTNVEDALTGGYVRVAASDNELAVAHLHLNSMRLHRRAASGGAWNWQAVQSLPIQYMSASLLYSDDLLHVASYDAGAANLLYFNSSNWGDKRRVNLEDGDHAALGPRLLPFDGEFMTPAFSLLDGSVVAYKGEPGSGFEKSLLATEISSLSQLDMAVAGDRALVTFLRLNWPVRLFYSVLEEGVWKTGSIDLPGLQDAVVRCAALNDEFYVVYRDWDGMFRCARGVPPVE